ncbi:MAG: ABC transporter permease subunit [Pirellulales bacterium]
MRRLVVAFFFNRRVFILAAIDLVCPLKSKAATSRRTPYAFAFAAVVCVIASTTIARADALDRIRDRGALVWGADKEGGAPFVFPDEDNPAVLRGFEVELADMLADELTEQLGSPIKAEFKQGQWENLPLMLDGAIDVVLNGYELTPERERDYLCTRPYYLYGLQLMAPREGPIHSWSDVRSQQPAPWRAGALTGSAAYRHLERNFAGQVEVVGFDGNTNAMERVRSGALDFTLQDDCIAIFYADRFPELKFVGRPVDEGYYVALLSREEPRLHAALNQALSNIIRDGRLHELYDRWDMSGKAQMLALRDTGEIAAAPARSFGEILAANGTTLLAAAGMTVFLSMMSMPLAIAIGVLVAIGRLYGPRWLGWPLAWYVEILRGTPLLLQLLALFYLLPKLGVTLPALVAAIAGLAINYSAYEAEIYRAGMQAIPRGQMEAALALGMTRAQAVRRIILPQAFRIVIPPVTNDFIALFKDTSVCSVITVVELTKQYSILALSTGAIVELACITAVLYLLMSYPLSLVARYSERRYGVR